MHAVNLTTVPSLMSHVKRIQNCHNASIADRVEVVAMHQRASHTQRKFGLLKRAVIYY